MVFRIPGALLALACLAAPALAQTATTSIVYSFSTDLRLPVSPIIQASDGHYYGVTVSGAPDAEQNGGIYRMTPGAQNPYSLVHAFAKDTSEGVPAQAGLVEGPNGNLYGVTQSGGGVNNNGTFYSVNPLTGAFTVLHSFGEEASRIYGAPTLGSDGNFYLASAYGGSHANGSIAQITPSGVATLLYGFSGPEGENPIDSLLETSPGTFYGTAEFGGAHGNGSIFKVVVTTTGGMPSATVTDVYDFNDADDYETGAFTAGPNGNLYTTSDPNGDTTYGAILEFNPATAALTAPFTFTANNSVTYGFYPSAPLFLGSDNNFYTATAESSFAENGDILRITPGGAVTTIFDGSNEQNSQVENAATGVIQGSDGNLYLQTEGGTALLGDFVEAKFTNPLPGPVTLTFANSTVAAGTADKLSFTVANGYSTTLKQCYAYFQGSGTGGGNWSGLQSGTGGANSVPFTGSVMITPTAAGTYVYALTCGGKESGFATLTVTGGTKLAASIAPGATPNPVTIGQPLTLTANVTAANGHPTGSVTFAAGTTVIGTANLNSNGLATLANIPTSGEAAGNYALTAQYSGDSNFKSGSTGFNVMLVSSGVSTSISASATPDPVIAGSNVTLNVNVSSASGTPTGSVNFLFNGSLVHTSQLDGSGNAAWTATTTGLAAATYQITVDYVPTGTYIASNTVLPVTVNPVPTMTTVTVAPTPIISGQSGTVTIHSAKGTAGVSGGGISLSVTLGAQTVYTQNVTLDGNGNASLPFSTTGLATGMYQVRATLSGTSSYPGSTAVNNLIIDPARTYSPPATVATAPELNSFQTVSQPSNGLLYFTLGEFSEPSTVGTLDEHNAESILLTLPDNSDSTTDFYREGFTEGVNGSLYTIAGTAANPRVDTLDVLTAAGQFQQVVSTPLSDLERLQLGSDGNFYVWNGNTFYKITASGVTSYTPPFTTYGIFEFIETTKGTFLCETEEIAESGAIVEEKFFNVTSTGQFTLLNDRTSNFVTPQNLVNGPDGNVYATSFIAPGNYDIVRIAADGTVTPVDTNFVNSDLLPSTMIVGSDGFLYIVLQEPGAGGLIKRISTTGQETTVLDIRDQTLNSNVQIIPFQLLYQGSDGSMITELYPFSLDYPQGGYIPPTQLVKISANPPLPAPVQVLLSTNNISLGQSVNLTWNVTNAFGAESQTCAAYTQAGGGQWSGLLNGTVGNGYGGTATITPTADGTFTYAVTCQGKESGYAVLNVSGSTQHATTTSAGQAPTPAPDGSTVTLTADVTSAVGIPSGSVQFIYGTKVVGQATLDSRGRARIEPTTQGLPDGSYQFNATYLGTQEYEPSSGTSTLILVASSTVTLTYSPGAPVAGQPLTVTIQVTGQGVTGAVPTGTVQVSNFPTSQQPVQLTLVNGKATYTTSNTISGQEYISASYSGDGNYPAASGFVLIPIQ